MDFNQRGALHFNPLRAACMTEVRRVSHSARLAKHRRRFGGMRQSSCGKSSVTAQTFVSLKRSNILSSFTEIIL